MGTVGILPAGEPFPVGALPIDARTWAEYADGHVPSAIHMAWEDWCETAPVGAGDILAQPGYWGVLAETSPDVLTHRLEASGVKSDQPLVIYAGGARSRGRDGRIAWMLAYLGAENVYLLDGGINAWSASGGIPVADRPRYARGRFTIDLQRQRRIDLEHLRHMLMDDDRPILIDTRSIEEYEGGRDEYLPRRGRLPDALCFPFTELYTDADRYVSAETYMRRLPLGADATRPIVGYCEVGVRACTFALLHEIYTGNVVTVFDGSLMQWSLSKELPMVVGREGKVFSP